MSEGRRDTPHVRGSVMDPTPPAGAHAARSGGAECAANLVGGAMNTLSHNTIIRPVLTLGALVQRHEVVPGRRIWIKDTEGRYLFANAAMAADAGGEILGMLDADLPWADRVLEYAAADAEALSGPVLLRERVRAVGGLDREVITQKSPLLGARGQVIGTLGLFDVCSVRELRTAERNCERCAQALAAELRYLLAQAEPTREPGLTR